MVFLKISGGRGMAATGGILILLLFVYEYWAGYPILLAVFFIPLILTRNVALSSFVLLLFLPLVIWLGTKSGQFTVWSIITGVLIGLSYLPAAGEAWCRTGNMRVC